MRHSPCVTTSIPAGFHLVLPCQPLTHIAPRLTTGMVPSPSPNLTPDRTCRTQLCSHCFKRHLVARAEGTSLDGSVKQRMGNVAKECQLTSGTDPPTETAVSIHSDRASGKSSGVRGVVTLSHAPGVWSSHFHIVRRGRCFLAYHSEVAYGVRARLVLLILSLHVPVRTLHS